MKRHLFRRMGRFLRPQALPLASISGSRRWKRQTLAVPMSISGSTSRVSQPASQGMPSSASATPGTKPKM